MQSFCDEGVIRRGESTETGLAEIHLVRVSVKIAENEMKTCSGELLTMSSRKMLWTRCCCSRRKIQV